MIGPAGHFPNLKLNNIYMNAQNLPATKQIQNRYETHKINTTF